MIDANQEILIYPCSFPIKALGRNTDEFEALVVDIVRRHAPDLDVATVTSRDSSDGKYRSVTATFTAYSRAQLDALYQELNGHEHVLFVL